MKVMHRADAWDIFLSFLLLPPPPPLVQVCSLHHATATEHFSEGLGVCYAIRC